MNDYNRTRNRGMCSSWSVQQDTEMTNKTSCRPVCRSAFMRAEEIERERAASGWNPYAGEEENPQEEQMAGMDGRMTREWVERRQMNDWQTNNWRMDDRCRPYYQMPDYAQVLEDMKMTEREFRKLQTMYPETAKMLLPYVEDACDRMEYEGSPMFDEYPDQTTILRIQDRILEQVKDRIPAEEEEAQEQTDMVTMQFQGRRRVPPGRRRMEELIRVLLLQEMHHRRCRHRGCRRGY